MVLKSHQDTTTDFHLELYVTSQYVPILTLQYHLFTSLTAKRPFSVVVISVCLHKLSNRQYQVSLAVSPEAAQHWLQIVTEIETKIIG